MTYADIQTHDQGRKMRIQMESADRAHFVSLHEQKEAKYPEAYEVATKDSPGRVHERRQE